MATYGMREPWQPTVNMNELGAIIAGTMVEVVHDDSLSPGEKVAGIKAVAVLARLLAEFWDSQAAQHGRGPGATRLWNRLAGLSREGEPERMLARVAEQVAAAERESEQDGGLDA